MSLSGLGPSGSVSVLQSGVVRQEAADSQELRPPLGIAYLRRGDDRDHSEAVSKQAVMKHVFKPLLGISISPKLLWPRLKEVSPQTRSLPEVPCAIHRVLCLVSLTVCSFAAPLHS